MERRQAKTIEPLRNTHLQDIWLLTDIQQRQDTEQAAREREELLSLALEATGLGVWEMELPSRRTSWSPRLKAMAGLPADTTVDDAIFYRLVHPEDQARVEQEIAVVVDALSTNPYTVLYRVHRGDNGEERWWQESSRLVMNAAGVPTRLVGAIQDVTERQRADIERQTRERRWRHALKAAHMVAWERVVGTSYTERSDNSIELLGLTSGPAEEFTKRVQEADRAKLLGTRADSGTVDGSTSEFRYNHPDGRELWMESSVMLIEGDGGPARLVGVTSDITLRKAAEERLRFAAGHDALTGLLNRTALQADLERAVAAAQTWGRRVALLLVDLDNFKTVNDTLGHDAGDVLLRIVAQRLRSAAGPGDCVARLGGDEFAMLIESAESLEAVERLAMAVLDDLRQGFSYRGKLREASASLGIACFPDHGTAPVDILKNADLALYAAKTMGRARVSTFAPAMRRAVEERAALLAEVKRALPAQEFTPYYQPKIDLASGALLGFEALARWSHPVRGLLGPEVFGDAFADGELAVAVSEAMLLRLMADMRTWRKHDLAFGRIAVNLSTYDFMGSDFAERVLAHLAQAEIPPSCLEIEVTETVVLDRRARDIAVTLKRLHEHGIKIALDDFGTGYASLTHLKHMTVDELKIDRSFVHKVETDPADAAIVGAVIGLAAGLNLTVVAEGIETAGQAAKLRAMGCQSGQGYHFAKPMPASRVPWFVERNAERLSKALVLDSASPGTRKAS